VSARRLLGIALAAALCACGPPPPPAPIPPRAVRLLDRPIITPELLPGDDGGNINGPSLIRAPDWLPDRLGDYYLYFAHHRGRYIRLAYANSLTGPWTVYEPGTLRVEGTPCDVPDGAVRYEHVASPDVHVDEAAREIRMYFHCPAWAPATPRRAAGYRQVSLLARSRDGLRFEALPQRLGKPYFRVFEWDGAHYALAMPGVLFRSPHGLRDFRWGPRLRFPGRMRHAAVMLRDGALWIFFTQIGDDPERILLSRLELNGDWMGWRASAPAEVLAPERPWEGAGLPQEASVTGWAERPVNQLRDPALFHEAGVTYLLYAVAGEHGIAIARLEWP
jgi:hypothetical protein